MAINFTPGQQPSTVNKAARAIMANVTVTHVTPIDQNYAPPVTRDVTRALSLGDAIQRIEALERQVAELIAAGAPAPSPKAEGRAEYMREYRKRRKG